MEAVHYDSYTGARANLKDVLDAVERGRLATVRRDRRVAAVVDGDRLRRLLATTVHVEPQLVGEAGGWSLFLPGLPLAADGSSFDEAVAEMVLALREYAADWQERLLDVPSHRDNWGLVQLVALSDDAQLRDWLVGTASDVPPSDPY